MNNCGIRVWPVLCWLLVVGARRPPESSFALLDVQMHGETKISGMCVNFQQFFNHVLPQSPEAVMETNTAYDLNWWREEPGNLDVCNKPDSDLGGEIIPMEYVSHPRPTNLSPCLKPENHSYYIQGQMQAIKDAGAAAALFLLKEGTPSDFHGKNYLFSRFYNPKVRNDTPTFFMYTHQFERFKGLVDVARNHGPTLLFYRPADPFLDAGVLVLLALAVGCILLGCAWYVRDLRERVARQPDALKPPEEAADDAHSRATSPDSLRARPEDEGCGCCGLLANGLCAHVLYAALALVIVASVLLLSFFYRNVAVEFFNVFLVVGGTFAISRCALALLRTFYDDPALHAPAQCLGLDCEARHQKWYLPHCFYEAFRPVGLMVALVAFAICLTWYLCMDDLHAFYFLDLINACICVYSVRSSEIRSLRFITFFLVAMFVYDIVMVFGTRLITENGCSVMVQVVTGVDCQKFRPTDYSSDWPVAPVVRGWADRPKKIPLLFYIPLLSNPVDHCFEAGVEGEVLHIMLGLGDVIAPGYLIAFAFYLDVWQKSGWYEYGATALAGYAFGMLSTFVALNVMETAQPALIYLVPGTLLPLLALCAWKRTLRLAWTGAPN